MNFVLDETSGETMVEIDQAFWAEISSHRSGSGWTRDQFLILGIGGRLGQPFTPPRGWKQRLRGKRISRAEAMALREVGRRARAEHERSARRNPTLFG